MMLKFARVPRRVVSLLFVASALLALSACGPRTGRIDAAALDPQQLVIDMPALYIDFDSNGQASIGGTPVAQLGGMIGADLSQLQLPADQVGLMTAANIQHIQINNTEKGLMLAINGAQIPSLGWDGETLQDTLDTLGAFNAPVPPAVQNLVPLLTKMGVGAVLRFPLTEGAAAIPLTVAGDSATVAAARKAQTDFLASVGEPPVIKMAINYAPDGTWTIDGKNAADWSALLPVDLGILTLPPNMVQSAVAAGVQNLTLASKTEGIFVSINGKTLPHITWADGELQNVVKLLSDGGVLDATGLAPLVDQLMSFLPVVQTADFSLTVNFPQ